MNISDKYTKALFHIDRLIDSVLLLVLYAVGVCRYRSVLVLSVLMLMRFTIADEKMKYVKSILAPVLIFSLILDIKFGQYFPIYPTLSPIISVLIFVTSEYIFVVYVKYLIPRLSNNKVFTVCPKCYFNNGNLVTTCGGSNCGYSCLENTYLHLTDNEEIENCKIVSNQIGSNLPKTISKRKRAALNLRHNEILLANIRVSPFSGVYKNGSKLFINSLIITDSRIILIKYGSIAGGWKTREDLALSSISSIKIGTKWHITKVASMLEFKLTNDNTYELFYSTFDKSNQVLDDMAGCIKSLNGNLGG